MVSNFLKKHEWKIKAYFESPFICWGIAFLILEKLDEFLVPVHQFRSLLWVNELNLVFFIPATFMAISMVFTPYRNGIIFMLKNKQNVGNSLLYIGSIIIAFLAEGIFYKIGIVTIIGNQFKETITNQQYFEQIEFYLLLMTFFFVPSVIIYLQSNIKKEFVKYNILICPIKWDNLIIFNWLMFILLLIGFWIFNIFVWHSLPLQNEI